MDFDSVINEATERSRGNPVRERVRARFAVEPLLDEEATREARRPVFEQIEMIYLTVPDDPITKRRRATPADKQRFAREWNWFLDTSKDPAEGLPIDQWPLVTAQKAAELKWFGISTVQLLASWDLENRPLNPDDAALVGLAQLFLEGRDEKDEAIAKLTAENEELRAQLEACEKSRATKAKIQ